MSNAYRQYLINKELNERVRQPDKHAYRTLSQTQFKASAPFATSNQTTNFNISIGNIVMGDILGIGIPGGIDGDLTTPF